MKVWLAEGVGWGWIGRGVKLDVRANTAMGLMPAH